MSEAKLSADRRDEPFGEVPWVLNSSGLRLSHNEPRGGSGEH